MPLYQVEIPGRGKFKVESPTELTDEQAYAAVLQDIGNAPPPKKGLLAALGKGAESTLSQLRTGVSGAFGSPEEAARAGLERGEEISGKYADQVSMEKVKEAFNKDGVLSAAKEVGRQIPLAIAEQAPNLATSLGGARLGAMAGTALGPAGTVAGGIAGGLAGAFLPSLIQQYGGNLERQAQEQTARGEPLNINAGAAGAAAVPQAALDVAQAFIPFGGKLISKLTGIPEKAFFGKSAEQVAKLADEKLLATLAKGTATGVLAEVPTEIAQQMLERAQAGLSLTSPDAMKEYGQTAYQVGLLGPLGAVGRLSERGAARQDVAAKQAAEQEAAAQAAQVPPPPAPPEAPAPAEAAPPQALLPAPEPMLALPAPTGEAPPPPVVVPQGIRETERPGAVMAGRVMPEPPNLGRAMEAHDLLKNKLAALQKQMQDAANAGDTAKINELYAQYEPLEKEVETSAQTIEGLGGTTQTPEELETQSKAALASIDTKIKNAQKKLADAAQLGSFGELPKLTTKLDELKKERTDLMDSFGQKRSVLQEKATNLEQRGQTRDLFTEEEAPIPVAQTKEEALAVEQPPTAAPTEVLKEAPKADTKTMDLFGEANLLRTAINNGDESAIERATKIEEQRQRKARNAKVEEEKTTTDSLIKALDDRLDLAGIKRERADYFGQYYDNKQKAQFDNGTNNEAIQRPRLDKNGQVVIGKDGLPIIENVKLQDVYDTGGASAVEYELIKDEIDAQLRKISTRQGNAKKSVLERIDEYNDQLNTLSDQFESGIAAPTMAEKVENLKAKQGKGEARGTRQLDAKEKYDLKRKIDALTKRRDALVETNLKPIEKAIEAIHAKLYTTTPVEKKSVAVNKTKAAQEAKQEKSEDLRSLAIRLGKEQDAYKTYEDKVNENIAAKTEQFGEDSNQVKRLYERRAVETEQKALELGKATPEYQKALAAEIASRKAAGEVYTRPTISRAAKTTKRINEGNVRKEAETSEKMRDLAIELGQREPEFEKFSKDLAKRMDALEARYGEDDPRVKEFRRSTADMYIDKAIEFGKKTPEYKATLKEQIEYFKETLAQSKQETPSKRTEQETRRVQRAPKEFRTATSESDKESSTATKVKTRKGTTETVGPARTGKPPMAEKNLPKPLRVPGKVSVKTQERIIREVNDSEGGTAYRTRETEGGTVDARQAADFMEKVQSKLPENVKLVYAATPGKIPMSLLKRMSEEGIDPTEAMVQGAVFSDGTVLVVGDQHADLKDLEATVFHELVGHYGIDTIIGIPRLQAYANKTDLRQLALDIGGQKLLDEVTRTAQFNAAQGKSEAVQKLQVLREIIAHTEEARVTESFREKAGRWLKELVGMIRAGLRDLGFTSSSVLSTSDVFYALKESRKAFETKTIGAYRAADGQMAFRTKQEPTQYGASFIAKEKSLKDQFLGNVLGLTGRVQFIDKDAALSEAFKRGVADNVITSLEAQNAEFYLRFGQQRSQYAGQALTNGKLILRKGEGGGYVYDSVKGANMLEVAEALHKGKFANDTEAEAILTAYVAGERAKVKGWQKLNYENPALAEKEYNDVMRLLNSDKTKKDAVLEAARIYKEFNDGQIDFLVQTGAITEKLAKELKSVPYIPYYRVNSNSGNIELMVDKETPVRIGNVKTEPQLKELVGGNKNILPIFTSSVQNTFMLTDLALRNQMIKESAFLLQKMGIASALGEGSGPASDSTVRFKVNGKDHFVYIDKDQYGIPAELIIKGMEGIKTTMPAAIKMMGVPADILRKFVTRNPAYAVRQAVRDPLNAWLTTGTDATPILSSFRELASMVAGRSEVENKLMRSGAISSNVFTGDQRDASKFLKDITAGKSGWSKIVAKLDAFAMQGDASTRAVVYKDSLAKGMSEQAALLRTLESMNFSRRGLSPSMQALSIVIPFFNAQIQGLDVLYRAYTGQMPFSEQLKIKQKMMSRGLMIAAGTLAYAAMMSDDEAYKRAKPEERYGNWFVYIPGFDEPLRVPIPFELGYLFKALPEAIWDMASNDEKASKAVGGWLKLVAQTNPFTLPQAIKPITEVYLGKSFFGGDIESQREQKMLAGERSRESTTEFAKLLGSITGSETIKQITGKEGLSPIGIDYLIRGYTGGLGIGVLQMANPLLNLEMKEDVAKPTLKASKTPFIGGLFQPVEGRGTLDEAYDAMLNIQQTKGTFNRLVEQGKTAEARAFAQEHADKLAAASVSGSVQQKLGEFAKFRRQVEAAPKMTTEQKDEKLAQIDKAQTEYARAFLKAIDKTTRQ
jgi:hypothetical protein